MKKVSAVDWLAEQLLTKYRLKIDNYQEFEQAKEMLETLGSGSLEFRKQSVRGNV